MTSKGIILAVDDAPESLSLLAKILTPKGYEVNLADSGELALTAVTANPPDLILLDISMKGIDGFEVCRQLKGREDTRHIPIIFISSHTEMKQKLEGLKLGAVDYITKPFQLEELLMRVGIHMALSLANTSIKNQTLTLKYINEQLQDEVIKRQKFEDELQKNLYYTEHSRLALVSALEYQKKTEETLRGSELRYRRLFEAARDGILILDFNSGMVVDVNPFLVKLLGYSRDEFLDKKIWEIGFFCDIIENKDNFVELKKNEYIRYEDMALKSKEGRRIEVEFISNVYLVNHRKVIQCNIRDNTDKKRTEVYQKIELDIINILNESDDMAGSIQHILAVLKEQTGFDAVGFRLQDGDDYPYIAQQGFSADFLAKENSLIKCSADGEMCRDKNGEIELECTCGMVISNKVDSENPFLTRGGSFWTNDSTSLLNLPIDKDLRIRPRNECIHQGYGSMALIPIRTNNKNIGLIHINDRRKGCFTLDIIERLEGVASHFGNALIRKQAEDALRESEEHYRALFQSSADGIVITDSETKAFKYVNPSMCRMLGYTDEEIKKLVTIQTRQF
ncbi:MAG: response regulator [bacterium]